MLAQKQRLQTSRGRAIKMAKIQTQLEAVVLRNKISVKSWIGVFFGLPSIKARRVKSSQ